MADANITFGYDLRIFQNLCDIKYYTLRHVDIETRNWNACNSIGEPWKLRIIQSLLLRYLFSYWFNTYGYNISGFSIQSSPFLLIFAIVYLCLVFVSLCFIINLFCLLKMGLKVENIWIIKSGLGSWHLLGYCSVLNKMHFQLSQYISCCTTCISLNGSRIDQIGISLRLGFINLREHKFRHNFHDTLKQLCTNFCAATIFLPLVQLLWMILI